MALPRSLNFLRVGTGPQVLEVYLDLLCPYSAKITRSLNTNVLPLIAKGAKYDGKLSIIARAYPQPFHYFSHYTTEALIAFGYIHPDLVWQYMLAIYDEQKAFFNVPSQDLTARQFRDKLADIAVNVLEASGKIQGPKSQLYGQFRDSLDAKTGADGSQNKGGAGFDDMKYCIKVGRQNSIHVTPTTLFDGLIDNSISSSWGKAEWEKYLSEKL